MTDDPDPVAELLLLDVIALRHRSDHDPDRRISDLYDLLIRTPGRDRQRAVAAKIVARRAELKAGAAPVIRPRLGPGWHNYEFQPPANAPTPTSARHNRRGSPRLQRRKRRHLRPGEVLRTP